MNPERKKKKKKKKKKSIRPVVEEESILTAITCNVCKDCAATCWAASLISS